MNNTFFSLLKDYIQFLKNPAVKPFVVHKTVIDDWKFKMSFMNLFKWIIVVYAFVLIVLGPLLGLAVSAMGVSNVLDMNTVADMRNWRIFLLAIFWAPFVEEIVFRYWFKGLGRYGYIFLLFAVIGLLLGFRFAWLVFILVVMFLAWLPFEGKYGIILGKDIGCAICSEQFVRRSVYISSLVFGCMHWVNYDFSAAQYVYLAPLLILPQLCVGTFLAWLRLRYSVMTGIVFHMVYNSIPLLSIFIMSYVLSPEELSRILNMILFNVNL